MPTLYSTMIPKGIHPGLGMTEYHSWKLDRSKLIEGPISCSTLKRFAPNPYEWLHTPEITQTAAMRTGSLFDLAITAPRVEFDAATVISPFDSFRTKEAQEWKKEQEGKLIITQEERDKALLAADCVWEHDIAGNIMHDAEFQVGVVGDVGNIPAKCLIDILPREEGDWGETIVDYKTTGNGIDDDSIRKSLGQFGYHWQAAFYRTLWNKVSPDRHIEDFAFIFQSTATLEVRVVKLSDDALTLGNRAVKDAVEEFVRCAHKGIGSRYAKRVDTLDLMPYHAMSEDERLSEKEGVGV